MGRHFADGFQGIAGGRNFGALYMIWHLLCKWLRDCCSMSNTFINRRRRELSSCGVLQRRDPRSTHSRPGSRTSRTQNSPRGLSLCYTGEVILSLAAIQVTAPVCVVFPQRLGVQAEEWLQEHLGHGEEAGALWEGAGAETSVWDCWKTEAQGNAGPREGPCFRWGVSQPVMVVVHCLCWPDIPLHFAVRAGLRDLSQFQ